MLVDFLQETTELSGRLKLLRYVAEGRRLLDALRADIRKVCNRIEKLSMRRNDVAHRAAVASGPLLRAGNREDWIAGVQRKRSDLTWPVREIPPQSLARIVGWKVLLKDLAPRMRCSRCGKKAAELVAVARPRPRGGGRRMV